MKKAHQTSSMLRAMIVIPLFIFVSISLSALTLINENIQSWTAYTSYGSYTQTIPAGTVSMTRCMVSPNAAATGTCSSGRIQCEAVNGIVEFPQLASVGQVEVHLAAGSTGRSIKLQKRVGDTWMDLTTITGITTNGATFFHDVNLAEPTTLRLAAPSHAVYVHDIIVTDFQNILLPIVTTGAISNITYSTATASGNVENAGASAIISRGFCWSASPNPDLEDDTVTAVSGIGLYSAQLTNLTPDTDYHVRAYATNSNGTSYGENVLFRTANIGVPSLQASNLVLYPGSTSILASWTPGNGSKRIVKINTTNSFTLPADGINYIANPIYNSIGEQVVYNGATQIIEGEAVNTVSVTGLTPNTTYWLRVFDYNGEGATALYNTSPAANNPSSTVTLNTVLTGYYEDITGTGATLKTNLHNLLRTTHLTAFSYDALWTQLQYTDEDSVNTNNIIQIYTGWSIPKSYSGGGTSQWNREHTWSKSHGDFGDVPKAGTDLHHLRPCDATVNSAKGNKDFDEGGTEYIDSSPYTGYSGNTGCYTDTDSWEPRDAEKGDIARMILYMAVRYEGTDTTYDLEMQDITPTTGPYYGKLSNLLQWHVQDPPNGWERRRNNRIHERQGNRNPFVDHPEFVNQIWAPSNIIVTATSSTSFVLNWTPAVNAQSYVLDVSTSSNFSSFVTGYQNFNTGSNTSWSVTVPVSNTTYYCRLRSFFTSGYSMYSDVAAVTMSDMSVVFQSVDYDWSWSQQLGYYIDFSWLTTSESNLEGFYVYRSLTSSLNDAVNITPQIIPAHNTSTPHGYDIRDTDINSWTFYCYWIQCVGLSGGYLYNGPYEIYVGEVANEDETQAQSAFAINQVYPNPFRNQVSIGYNLPKSETVEVKVYNLKGQVIKTLLSGLKTAGQHSLNWDGKDEGGNPCSAGVYFIQLQSGQKTHHKKLLLY